MEKIDKITDILLRLNKNSQNPVFGENDKGLLAEVQAREVALAQIKMLGAGVAADELWRLWDRNRRVLPDQASKLRAELAENHVLQRVLAEHEMILCFIADLDDVNTQIQRLDYASSSTMEIRKLAHIAGHLISSEQHREREEEVIFPQLRKEGYCGLLQIINKQHIEISRVHRKLNELVWKIDTIDFDSFKFQLEKLVGYLVPAVRMHIFMEGNIIFPLAIEIINDNKVWTRMKDVCDQIGYCGYDAR